MLNTPQETEYTDIEEETPALLKARALLKMHVKRAANAGEIQAEILTLTPALATALLENNPDNRKIRKDRVLKYASDMRAGKWVGLNGQTIVVTEEGMLNDGQNRCVAVIEADARIQMMFLFGVTRESRMTLDAGASRTAGNYLHMSGVKNANNVAKITRLLLSLVKVKGGHWQLSHWARQSLTNIHLTDYAIEHEEEINHAVKTVNRGDHRILTADSNLAASYIFINRGTKYDQAVVDGFYDDLLYGEGLQKGDPALVLRRRLILGRNSLERLRSEEVLELIIKAWNNRIEGKSVRSLKITGNIPKAL